MKTIFLLRHATPNWHRKDIPYDLPPGPELTPQGEAEARALGEFLHGHGLQKLYHSPFERAARTANIIAEVNGIPSLQEPRLREWRFADEAEVHVRARVTAVFGETEQESAVLGPIGLVSHGGPIALLLLELGFHPDELAPYRKMFDTTNPLPPAGAWLIEQNSNTAGWRFELAYTPDLK